MDDPRWKVARCESCALRFREGWVGRYEGGHTPSVHGDTIGEVIDEIHALTTEVS